MPSITVHSSIAFKLIDQWSRENATPHVIDKKFHTK